MALDVNEAIELLAEDILENIELQDVSLSSVMLKCARLARLLKDEDNRRIFAYEAGGYPSSVDGVPADVFELGRASGRAYEEKAKDGSKTERMSTTSVEQYEKQIASNEIALAAAVDRNVSVSSANPNQIVFAPMGNSIERRDLRKAILNASKSISKSRAYAYEYANAALYEIQFSSVANEIFDRVRENIDRKIIQIVPAAANKTASINENLQSQNPEDWANAVHGCRRLLQATADELFPARESKFLANGKEIKLGPDQYINRLIAFIEEKAGSKRFEAIVGSTLAFVGERLDAIFKAAQKGSHAEISSQREAERYVIYTYLTVGDILELTELS